jgi:hypothetical protein
MLPGSPKAAGSGTWALLVRLFCAPAVAENKAQSKMAEIKNDAAKLRRCEPELLELELEWHIDISTSPLLVTKKTF